MRDPVLLTGSAGFIGSHVRDCFADGRDSASPIVGLDIAPDRLPTTIRADIRRPAELRQAAGVMRPRTIVHLAAKAEVVLPFNQLADLVATNINGTINVLDAMGPERFVLASSGSVYGNATGRGASPHWSCVNPLGAYAMSKAAAELACAEWARESGGIAVALRFGNVIGRRCRGLIGYLVEHALRHPGAETPAALRGGGTLIRDYVPVSYVARAIQRATEIPLSRGSSAILNVASGRGLTNRAVAEVVQRVLRDHGVELTMTFGSRRAPCEAKCEVLETAASNDKLGLRGPTEEEVIAAIEDATVDHLAAGAVAAYSGAAAGHPADRHRSGSEAR
jgi:nucleoside-diphosphate-sugar epimerase